MTSEPEVARRLAAEDEAVAWLDLTQATVGASQREQLRAIARVHSLDLWEDWGAHDSSHWLSMRMGISYWKASRLIAASLALVHLPLISDALVNGQLGLDKVLELTRFATEKSEQELIEWARVRTPGAIRREGDIRARRTQEEAKQDEEARSVNWWFSEGRFGLEADLPAAQGATVVKALERAAGSIPVMPGEDHPDSAAARRADALVALCLGGVAAGGDPDRATVIVHARLEGLASNASGCEIEGAGVIHPESVRRLLCNARVQSIMEDEAGNVLGVGRMHREPSAWLVRQVRHRDRECRFPNCGARRFTQAHHVKFWSHGGRTELDNLLLICWFHHRLVHEYGWKVVRSRDGTVTWFWPDGTEHRVGDSPKDQERRALGEAVDRTLARLGITLVDEEPAAPGPLA